MIAIHKARSQADIAEAKQLIEEFFDFIFDRYPERQLEIKEYMVEQNLDKQIEEFDQFFGPPKGECLLAFLNGSVIGTVMLRALDDDLCEMNRMFVRSKARGKGAGRMLCKALIKEAQNIGYQQMRLDAWDRQWEALPLYASLGFTREPKDPTSDPLKISMRLNLHETEV